MKKLMIKAGKGIFPFLILVFITGCWDYMEVEDRGYILAIAIDVAHPLSIGQEEREEYLSERDIEKMPLQMGQPKYAYTLQMPIIPHARIRPEAGAGETKDRTWELTLAGNSFFEANRQFSTRLDFPPFYEHLKAIIISEEVAREGIYEVLDVILRDHEMRRRTRIFITPGEAKKYWMLTLE